MTDHLMRERRLDVDAIKAREAKATEGPWAWESVAEKSNEFVVGLAWTADGVPILGQIDPPDDCAMTDTVIRRVEVGINETGHANFADADFIAHARQDIPDLLAEVERLRVLRAGETPALAQLRQEISDQRAVCEAVHIQPLLSRTYPPPLDDQSLRDADGQDLGLDHEKALRWLVQRSLDADRLEAQLAALASSSQENEKP